MYSSKQQALDGDPKLMQQINFTRNLDHAGIVAMIFKYEETETILDFLQGLCRNNEIEYIKVNKYLEQRHFIKK